MYPRPKTSWLSKENAPTTSSNCSCHITKQPVLQIFIQQLLPKLFHHCNKFKQLFFSYSYILYEFINTMYGRMYEDKNITICRKVETEKSVCNVCRALWYEESYGICSHWWLCHSVQYLALSQDYQVHCIAIYVQSQGLQKVSGSSFSLIRIFCTNSSTRFKCMRTKISQFVGK